MQSILHRVETQYYRPVLKIEAILSVCFTLSPHDEQAIVISHSFEGYQQSNRNFYEKQAGEKC